MGHEAEDVADILNVVCGATVEALRQDNADRRLALRRQITQLTAELDSNTSDVGAFLEVLERWLGGTPPTATDAATLDGPFRRVLRQMIQQVATEAPAASAQPIGESVLAQLVAAVVAAVKHAEREDEPGPARKLAAQLVNIEQQLPESHREAAVPFFENLRAVLGGADLETLQSITVEPYASLWQTVQYLLSVGINYDDTTRGALLDRLVHNAVFVQRAGDENLKQALAQALVDVERKSIAGGEEEIANLVAAIRAHLLGLDPTPHSSLLDGEELAAWRKIQRAGRSS